MERINLIYRENRGPACKVLVLLILSLFGAGAVYSQSSANGFKKVEFGFNIGYLDDLHRQGDYDNALAQIKKDGITNLRIYEPFTKDIQSHPALFNQIMSPILTDGFNVLLCLSNYPSDPSSDLKQPSYQTNAHLLKFTDRFAPTDFDGYKRLIDGFLGPLKTSGLLDNVSFEIGNEPDSKVYFWGSPGDFINLAKQTKAILENYNRPIYCCGFTSEFANNDQPRSQEYRNFLNDNAFFSGVNLSFHIYPNNKYPLTDISLKRLNNSIISEFNLFSYQTNSTSDKNNYFRSSNFGAYLVELLAFAYENNIKKIYFFDLVDLADKNESTLGFFDGAGNPKPCYKALIDIYSVIRSGYRVVRTANSVDIIGVDKHILYTLNGNSLESSLRQSKQYPEMGRWTILRN